MMMMQVKELTGEILTVIRWFSRWRSQLRRQTLKPFGAVVATATKHLNDAMVTNLVSIQSTLCYVILVKLTAWFIQNATFIKPMYNWQ